MPQNNHPSPTFRSVVRRSTGQREVYQGVEILDVPLVTQISGAGKSQQKNDPTSPDIYVNRKLNLQTRLGIKVEPEYQQQDTKPSPSPRPKFQLQAPVDTLSNEPLRGMPAETQQAETIEVTHDYAGKQSRLIVEDPLCDIFIFRYSARVGSPYLLRVRNNIQETPELQFMVFAQLNSDDSPGFLPSESTVRITNRLGNDDQDLEVTFAPTDHGKILWLYVYVERLGKLFPLTHEPVHGYPNLNPNSFQAEWLDFTAKQVSQVTLELFDDTIEIAVRGSKRVVLDLNEISVLDVQPYNLYVEELLQLLNQKLSVLTAEAICQHSLLQLSFGSIFTFSSTGPLLTSRAEKSLGSFGKHSQKLSVDQDALACLVFNQVCLLLVFDSSHNKQLFVLKAQSVLGRHFTRSIVELRDEIASRTGRPEYVSKREKRTLTFLQKSFEKNLDALQEEILQALGQQQGKFRKAFLCLRQKYFLCTTRCEGMLGLGVGQAVSVLFGTREVPLYASNDAASKLSLLRLKLNQRFQTEVQVFFRGTFIPGSLRMCNGVCTVADILQDYYDELNFAASGTTSAVLSNGLETLLIVFQSVQDLAVVTAQLRE